MAGRSVISYDDITLPPAASSIQPPASKKRKWNNNPTSTVQHWDDPTPSIHGGGPSNKQTKAKDKEVVFDDDEAEREDGESRELTHEEIWDDSALVDAWNAAMEEYEAYNGPDKGTMISQDEAFSRALSAMYWGGYWTAMYHCQRQLSGNVIASTVTAGGNDQANVDDEDMVYEEEEEEEEFVSTQSSAQVQPQKIECSPHAFVSMNEHLSDTVAQRIKLQSGKRALLFS
ncbi:uncharacterized protein LACBIDRAFT_327429 [Laccaria bicolor S238N-H82]|uniref:Predicted protein n=1 Tax=Laccaria bicolor (strain S238N-H82 / ATCC MYA-4686) TaxID=486041 RepID=B0DB21_LACBS|nr:uncharacterized protein LACBIDRAFT_327429 [Laccaria bicolor S238N-H82]EDR08126.1 predicted protein [Laccaria bicolor S238N-H82]|eukprot:XP_001881196.1 predicted protein [Laccaria bicolor S238N-H82]